MLQHTICQCCIYNCGEYRLEILVRQIVYKNKSGIKAALFLWCRRRDCLGFAPRSESFAFEPAVQLRSISSLSGLTSCRPSANPLEPAIYGLKPSPLEHIKKRITIVILFLIVVKVTILEPMIPDKNTCLSAGMSVYAELIRIMKESTTEYYNMRIALGLECA